MQRKSQLLHFICVGLVATLLSVFISLLPYDPAVGSEIKSLAPTTAPQRGIGWEIQSTSGTAEIDLAKHLTRVGAKMYSAYWCPHCYEQKQLFGKRAWAKIASIECATDAKKNPQPEVCSKAGVKVFPTWVIGGKLDTGVKKLAELGKMTGYKGNTAFKYDRLFGK
jgi:glutaredoxin